MCAILTISVILFFIITLGAATTTSAPANTSAPAQRTVLLPTFTPSAEPPETATATSTMLASEPQTIVLPTPMPTQTASPSVAMPQQATTPVLGIVNQDANLRSGPGTDHAIIGGIGTGQQVNIVATNAAGDWYLLDGGKWIAAFLVDGTPTAPTISDSETAGEEQAAVSAPLPSADQVTNPVVASGFADPNVVCNALADEGLGQLPGTKWRYLEGLYACVSDTLEVTVAGYAYLGDIPNTIEYYAESAVAGQVQRIMLLADIYNEGEAQPTIDRFVIVVQKLFNNLGLVIPEGLIPAISNVTPMTFDLSFGKVTLVREAYRLGFGLNVIIEEASYLEARAQRRAEASETFEQCRQVIAQLRGYPVFEVVGDGDPIDVDQGISFFLTNRNNDQFFCEVSWNGDYEITAAIGGQYPFKEIGSGNIVIE
jgi:hypothetical protein